MKRYMVHATFNDGKVEKMGVTSIGLASFKAMLDKSANIKSYTVTELN